MNAGRACAWYVWSGLELHEKKRPASAERLFVRTASAFDLRIALCATRRSKALLPYCRLAINASSADFGGRVNDSGSVARGSSTMPSRSMNVGFSVLM